MVRKLSFVSTLVFSFACGTDEEPPENHQEPITPLEVACEDAAVLELGLQTSPDDGEITNTDQSGEWLSEIDATSNGAFTPGPFVYAAFTDEGLTKIGIDDEEALAIPAWDIAFRRYVIRINSGNSGVGKTVVARMPSGVGYDDLNSVNDVPANITFREDEFFTPEPDCSFINDGSGLEDAPATALSGYYSYQGCVQMTYTVYVTKTATERYLKLMITHYYSDSSQQTCQDDPGSFSPMGAGSANFQIRWGFLD